MTTLQALGFTLAGGTAVMVTSIGLFGVAVSMRSTFIAPRAAARPRNVIYHPKPEHKCQDRGGPVLGWIPWTLGLPYDTMLQGIPGTGTREGGMTGSLLRVNLDGIVLLRFHALCLRVAAVASFLCLTFILPMYISAQCYRLSDQDAQQYPGCASKQYNLTNYERLTMANVPSLNDANNYTDYSKNDTGIRARLYGVVLIFWIIAWYLVSQLHNEWIQLLAMRRVYYLEYDVWGERREELKQTLLYKESRRLMKRKTRHFSFEEEGEADGKRASETAQNEEDDKIVNDREPWIPHPEQRDTVPNVALYSLLVGGLPCLPEQAADALDKEATVQFSRRQCIDWQLAVTTAFFDHCVPNQPGFSSSVAAVTIIPGSRDIALAWRKWYAAAANLRRLRFIRKQIAKKRHFEIQVDEDEEMGIMSSVRSAALSSRDLSKFPDETPRAIYNDVSKNAEYYKEVMGATLNEEDEDLIYESLTFGPEQAAVYSREFAQAAAPCCPNGCNEGRILKARIDELLEMEQAAAIACHEANRELKEARNKAVRNDFKPSESLKPSDTPIATPQQATTAAQAASTDAAAKRHQRISSLDDAKMPDDLELEAKLFKKLTLNRDTSEKAAMPSVDRHISTINEASLSSLRDDSHVDPSIVSHTEAPSMIPSPEEFEHKAGLRQEGVTQWELVESIVRERDSTRSNDFRMSTGTWKLPSWRTVFTHSAKKLNEIKNWAVAQSAAAVDDLARESTYAVVTFTSRQAAVAARNCLADGRGAQRWIPINDIPIPPLADAAAWDPMVFRNCCRPVTLSIPDRQKNLRQYVSLILLGFIYIFYTIPLTAAASLVDPTRLDQLFPNLSQYSEDAGFEITKLLSGFMTALIWTSFFASCPILFKSIANFGSKATSIVTAEFRALQYFWWFMLLTAFTGQLLTQSFLNAWNDNLKFGTEIRGVLRSVALTVPSTISASWLNWILFRFTITLPLNYLLQLNAFLFHGFGMKCCARLLLGGGPGGPVPYRLYVDSGVVLMCLLSLAPASPLIAPACYLYFLICQPLLRRNLIFVYRPRFDGGGLRWPFLFDMCISVMVLGELLLAIQMGLKEALGPAIASAIMIFPTISFQHNMRRKYLRAFQDAALLQTSLLDGWDTSKDSSEDKREEFRQFLVDAHKAAYVPVCLAAGDDEDFLTAEPAVVVPLDSDMLKETHSAVDESVDAVPDDNMLNEVTFDRRMSQKGATLRRTIKTLAAMRRRSSSAGSGYFNFYKEDEFSTSSPFERSVSSWGLLGAHKVE